MVEGEQLTPNLQLAHLIGPEGSSCVWRGHHSARNCDVAVKCLGRALARNSPQLHRFQREAEVASQIKNAHVAQVLEHGVSSSGEPFLVMELLEGEDLASRITRDGPMPLADVARLVCQLCQGLSKAHLLGLVHRNVKPSNVFLTTTADGLLEAKVLDVGLPTRAETTPTGRIPTMPPNGSIIPEYSSPEQIFGVKDVDFRADLWSIAVIAYYALTGRTPFCEKTIEGFTSAIEQGSFERPSAIVSSVPAAVDAWFVKALQRDPAARFGGTRELGDEFSRAAGVDLHERTGRSSVYPAAPKTIGHRAAMHSLSDRPSYVGSEPVTVIGTNQQNGMSAALLIAVIALIGVATLVTGLYLMGP